MATILQKCACENTVNKHSFEDIDFSKKIIDNIKTEKEFDNLSKSIRGKYHTMVDNAYDRYDEALKHASHLLDEFQDSVAEFVLTKIASGELSLKNSYFKYTSQHTEAGTNIYYIHIKDVKNVADHNIDAIVDSFECHNDRVTKIFLDDKITIEFSRFIYITQLTREEFQQEVINKAVDTVYKTIEKENENI